MSSHKDDIALRRAALLKAARSMVRLKHSIAADEELNAVLPELERQFDIAVGNGILIDIAPLLAEVAGVRPE